MENGDMDQVVPNEDEVLVDGEERRGRWRPEPVNLRAERELARTAAHGQLRRAVEDWIAAQQETDDLLEKAWSREETTYRTVLVLARKVRELKEAIEGLESQVRQREHAHAVILAAKDRRVEELEGLLDAALGDRGEVRRGPREY